MMMLNGTELKASIVLQAMVTGLQKSKKDPDFVVKMETFGEVKSKLCYGCAATLALTEMFGGGRSASEIMFAYAKAQVKHPNSAYVPDAYLSNVLQLEPSSDQNSLTTDELDDLEEAVNSVRLGFISPLIGFLTGEYNTSFDNRWELESRNWEEQLPKVERTIAEMIAAGY